MKKLLIVSLFLAAITSCNKKDDNNNKNCPDVTTTGPASEVATLRTYIQANNIIAVEDPRGFFYTIDAPGSGSKPTACSGVTVNYVGKLTDGTTFDSGNNVTFSFRPPYHWMAGRHSAYCSRWKYYSLPPAKPRLWFQSYRWYTR